MIKLALIASPLAFAWIDRWWGSDNRKTHAKVLAGFVLLALFLADWRLGMVGASVVAGRSVGFGDGVATGRNVPKLVVRSACPMLLTFVLTLFDWSAPLYLAPHFVATILLARWYGDRIEKHKDREQGLKDNAFSELTRGAVAGICVAAYGLVGWV